MIKISEQDTIMDIVTKINSCSEEELILEIPFGHPVLHNYLSLKILKSKAGRKNLTILTTDISSRRIGKPLGINYSIIKDKDLFEDKKIKQEILRHNFTFWGYIIFELKKFGRLLKSFFLYKTPVGSLKYYSPYDKIKKSGMGLLVIGFFASIVMLLFIFYFAVNKTYVEITPEITVKSKGRNIIYSESSGGESIFADDNFIEIKKITLSTTAEETLNTSGIDEDTAKRSTGIVTFYNELKLDQTLRPYTRLITENGLLYETTEWINIPRATWDKDGKLIPGTKEIKVRAKIYDNDGKIIGSRGNIPANITFTLPGLQFNRENIYAISKTEIKGGTDNYVSIVGENDLQNSKDIMKEKLRRKALEELKKKIDSENNVNHTTYEILGISDIIKYKDIKIDNIGDIKVGDRYDNIKMKGSITVETYIYNKQKVINKLKEVIEQSLLIGTEKLMYIDEKSLKITDVIGAVSLTPPAKIKATTEVEIGIAYNFDNNSDSYVQKLKTMIIGTNIEDAENILLNDTKISKVEINTTPFFIDRVSNITENIILKIKDR